MNAIEESFVAWMKQQPGVVGPGDTVNMGTVPGGWRGMLALRNIAKGETVIAIPRKLLLPSAIVDHDFDRATRATEALEWDTERMGFNLIVERARGERSPWHWYLASLPQAPSLELRDGEVEAELGGTVSHWLFRETLEQHRNFSMSLCRFAEAHREQLPAPVTAEHFTAEACDWAVSMTRSRSFRLGSDPNQVKNTIFFCLFIYLCFRCDGVGDEFITHSTDSIAVCWVPASSL